MPRFAVTALGDDHPGIAAAVTDALLALGANIEDSAMTSLGGEFAVMLLLAVPDEVESSQVEAALAGAAAEHDLHVIVRPAKPPVPRPPGQEAPLVVSVYGGDRPGIVHAVTSVLASAAANIVDLTTHLSETPEGSATVLVIDAVPSAGGDEDALRAELTRVAEELGVTVTVYRADPDAL